MSKHMEPGKYTRNSRDPLSFLIEETIPGGPTAGISDKQSADQIMQDKLRTSVQETGGQQPEPEHGRHRKAYRTSTTSCASRSDWTPPTPRCCTAVDLTRIIGGLLDRIPVGPLCGTAPALTETSPRIQGATTTRPSLTRTAGRPGPRICPR
ncbi:hypothetical protein PG997_003415 [Apiospora hydei]|uniref:Uncharacterized protein n=1 Tax=Apiospora hydei TaxID=1337664 RepID=A0ABR1WZ99_9PEZI